MRIDHRGKKGRPLRKATKPHASGALILTGRRQGKRIHVFINGKLVGLTEQPWKCLIRLVVAHDPSGSGLVTLRCNHVYRLRKEIDGVLGKGAGARIIVIGIGEEYRLPAKLRIAVSKCFGELVSLKLLRPEDVEQIKKVCQECTKAERVMVQLSEYV